MHFIDYNFNQSFLLVQSMKNFEKLGRFIYLFRGTKNHDTLIACLIVIKFLINFIALADILGTSQTQCPDPYLFGLELLIYDEG